MYYKPTRTDQYLQWDSHHSLSAKYSVIGTLTHRAKTVCTGLELLQRKLQHLRKVLIWYKYPHWVINRYKVNFYIATGRILATTIYIIQTTTSPAVWNIKHKLGTTTAKYKSTTNQMQAQYQQLFQNQNSTIGYVDIL